MRAQARVKYLIPLLVIPAFLLVASLYFFVRQGESSDWERHSVEVRLVASHFLKTLVDAETGQRGYIATGDHVFLEPYQRASAEWERELIKLREITRADSGVPPFVDEVERLSRSRMAELEENLARYDRGGPPSELVNGLLRGKHLMDAVRSTLDELDRREAELLAQRQSTRMTEARLTWLMLNAAFITYLVVVTRTLLLRKLAELERARAEEKAEHLRFAEMFMGIVGHDLRTPLNAIVMSAQLLQATATPSDRTVLERMLRSTDRMTRMISELLDLARSRLGGGMRIVRKPARLLDVVSHALDEVKSAYPNRDIRFEGAAVAEGEWDIDRIAQVVTNLLGNALQHGDMEQPVEMTLTEDATDVELRIRNQGEPISQTTLAHLFEPYRSGEAKPSGLGLGLFITQQIVLAHGGTIDCRSTREDGTVFTVRLPRHAEERAPKPEARRRFSLRMPAPSRP